MTSHMAREVAEIPAAVRRFLDKMADADREIGRDTHNALLKRRPHKRRRTDELWPTDVYTADGTTFDAEIIERKPR